MIPDLAHGQVGSAVVVEVGKLRRLGPRLDDELLSLVGTAEKPPRPSPRNQALPAGVGGLLLGAKVLVRTRSVNPLPSKSATAMP